MCSHFSRGSSHYSSDTRTLQPGDTFAAVRGERSDGHAYLADAIARGAGALIVESGAPVSGVPDHVEVVRVPDTIVYLGQLARQRLAELHPLVVAVTGSMGKTTTKNAIATVASQTFSVLAPKGNLNTLLGLSVTLLNELHAGVRVVVAEMGAYQPGDLAQICEYIQPAISVVTNVRPVHLERMGSIENVARAKGEIVDALTATGTACLNADDPLVRQMAARCRGRVLTYGAGTGVPAEISPALIQVPIPLLGAYQVYTALAAYSVGRCLGMSDAAINAGLARLVPEKGRLKPLPGLNGSRLIDDTYNASRDSTLAALEVLAAQPAARRFAVLGDMLELGSVERDAHREVLARALQAAGGVVTVGPRLAAAAAELAQAAAQPVSAFANSQEAGAAQAAGRLLQPQPGDLILIKGSEGMRMERITEQLVAPEVDRERELPRQEIAWKQI